jgi:hypothetical protein
MQNQRRRNEKARAHAIRALLCCVASRANQMSHRFHCLQSLISLSPAYRQHAHSQHGVIQDARLPECTGMWSWRWLQEPRSAARNSKYYSNASLVVSMQAIRVAVPPIDCPSHGHDVAPGVRLICSVPVELWLAALSRLCDAADWSSSSFFVVPPHIVVVVIVVMRASLQVALIAAISLLHGAINVAAGISDDGRTDFHQAGWPTMTLVSPLDTAAPVRRSSRMVRMSTHYVLSVSACLPFSSLV